MSEGSERALEILENVATLASSEVGAILATFDDMNIRGEQIVIASEMYRGNITELVISVILRSNDLVLMLNELALGEGINEVAVLYGARTLCLPD